MPASTKQHDRDLSLIHSYLALKTDGNFVELMERFMQARKERFVSKPSILDRLFPRTGIRNYVAQYVAKKAEDAYLN